MPNFDDFSRNLDARNLGTLQPRVLRAAEEPTFNHLACRVLDSSEQRMTAMVKLTWLPHWQAYSVRRDGRIIGMLRCKVPLPFRIVVEFA